MILESKTETVFTKNDTDLVLDVLNGWSGMISEILINNNVPEFKYMIYKIVKELENQIIELIKKEW